MANTLNLSLTDDLRSFVDSKAGKGTDFATPTEYLRSLIRSEKRKEQEKTMQLAQQLDLLKRAEDMLDGNFVTFDAIDKDIMDKLS